MKEFNTADVDDPEEKAELEAAFGEDADLIELEDEDLERTETPDYMLKDVLEEGDWVTIQHQAGNVTAGPVEDVDTVGFTIDPRNRVTSGYFGYGDFKCEGTDELGVVNELIDINGQPTDDVIDERL